MNHKTNPALLKVIQKKVDTIKKLEQKYWNEINTQREKLSHLDPEFEREFEILFPKEQSSLIYGCVDGVVLIRHSTRNNSNLIQVEVFDVRLEILLKQLPVPSTDGRMVNFSSFAKLGPSSTIEISKTQFNDFEFNNLRISVFKYTEEEKIGDWEDAVNDIQLAILGMNTKIQESDLISTAKKQNILDFLIGLKGKFDLLLDAAVKEEELQLFLKENPLIIQPYSNVYPKKKLGEDFITDFVFSNTLGQGINYTFVEIESANMPIFTKAGDLTAEFNHAYKQTLDWDGWLQKNISYMREKLPEFEKPYFLIIAGRSKDFSSENRAVLRSWNRGHHDTEFLTFDDLSSRLGELIANLSEQSKKSN